MNEKVIEWVQIYLKYIRDVTVDKHVRDEEGYKFQAVQHFQSNFDLEATDLAGNIDASIINNNLVTGAMYFPRKMLHIYAGLYPEKTRQALRDLFDESQPDESRITQAQEAFQKIEHKRSKDRSSKPANTYISLRFISLLLGYRYPNNYNPLKPAEWKVFARFVKPGFIIPHRTSPGEQYRIYNDYIEPLRTYIKQRPEIVEIKDKLTDGLAFKDEEFRWMAQDIIYVTAKVYADSKAEELAQVQKPELTSLESETTTSPSQDEEGTGFMPFEEHLEEYVVKNWKNIDFGEPFKMYYEEDGTTGQQYTTDVGIIDILALDKNNDFVVIELKRAESGYKVVGQVLNYMGWVQERLAGENHKVRGLIIVGEADKTLLTAVKPVADKVSLKEYRIKMLLEDK